MNEEKSLKGKILEIKNQIQKLNLKPSGRNQWTKSRYYTLGDILPSITPLLDEYDLLPVYRIQHVGDVDVMQLVISSTNSCEELCLASIRLPTHGEGDPARYMQSEGAVQSYARRYLWYMALDLCVCDVIEDTKPKAKRHSGHRGARVITEAAKEKNSLDKGEGVDVRRAMNDVMERLEHGGYDTDNVLNVELEVNRMLREDEISVDVARRLLDKVRD